MKLETTGGSRPSERILRVLSDKARARLAASKSTTRLAKGDEYLDLDDLERGVQQATGIAEPSGHILPRKAVALTAWRVILARISEDSLRTEAPPASPSPGACMATADPFGADLAQSSKPG